MKIGIIGTGNMGRSIGIVVSKLGHDVFFGARNPEGSTLAVSLSRGALAGSNDEAAAFGEVIIYTPRDVDPATVLSDVSLLSGKIVIDCANQEVPSDLHFPVVATAIAEKLAHRIPAAHVVKAFNTLPMEVFEHCPIEIRKYNVAAFVAADDSAAKTTVMALAAEMGFRAVDCGGLYQAKLLESAADLIRLLIIGGGLPLANFSITDVPPSTQNLLGGRQTSKLK